MNFNRIVLGASLVILSAACHREPSAPSQPEAPAATAAAAETATDAAKPPAVEERWILPAGLSPATTLQDLQQRFGEANVSAREIPGAEGESMRGVVLFPDDPTRRATLYFQDPEHLQGLSMISVDEADSRWKLPSGIGIGASLADVQSRNGGPFTFSGFDWDYGGTITDWRGGKLQPANDKAVSERMQLRMPEGGSGDTPYPMGDSEFSSADPRWKDLGIAVGGISVGFPGEDDL
jgi:hypothetical protein